MLENIPHGLSLKIVKNYKWSYENFLTCEFTVANFKDISKNVTTNHIARDDWLYYF